MRLRASLGNMHRWFFDARLALAFVLLFAGGRSALASWLDDDYYCRVYGCIVVSDGQAFDIYDRYRFAGGGTVAPGSELIAWTANPYEGSGDVDLVKSGSLDPTSATLNSELIGIDTDGDGLAELNPSDNNGNGVLDLGDSLPEFSALSGISFSTANGDARSVYIAARMDFSVYMRASVASSEGSIASDLNPYDVGFALSVSTRGSDAGFTYGRRAVDPNFVALPGVDSFGAIWQTLTPAGEFRRSRGTHSRRANAVSDQAVRLDMLLDTPSIGLEAGSGSVEYDIELRFYNR